MSKKKRRGACIDIKNVCYDLPPEQLLWIAVVKRAVEDLPDDIENEEIGSAFKFLIDHDGPYGMMREIVCNMAGFDPETVADNACSYIKKLN